MKLQTTRVFSEITKAQKNGYTTVSEQGSSRSAKTYNTVIWIVCQCLAVPKTTVSICRATLPSLKGSVLRDFIEVLQRIGEYSDKCFNKSDLIYTFPNGSWVEFFSCDNETKLRGRKRKILFVNEANELKYLEWQQLQLRTTQFSIIDYNPSFSDEHWICEVNKDPRTYHFISTYKDNPFLEQKVIDEIESLKRKNFSLWQIYGLGLQAQVEGLVFRNVDVVERIPETGYRRRRFLGVDFGYTNDPTAIVDVVIEEETKTLYIDELCYRTSMLTSDIVAELKPQGAVKVISESADPRLVQEIYRAGINIHPVVKYQGSVEAGLTKMQEYKIVITKHSTNVIKEFRNYTYSQDKEGKWLNTPIDVWNHAIDAIRYVVMSEILGGQRKPIDRGRIAKQINR
jgi:phage terminase large subunit